jgi:hypothetical protein
VTSEPASPARARLFDLAWVGAALLLAGLLLRPGVFSVDESHYLLAAQAMAERGSFGIENGYEELRSDPLLYFYTVIPARVAEVGTVSTVPPVHALLAAPWLAAFGLSGLFWLNILSFASSVLAVRILARRLRPGEAFASLAAGAYLFASMSFEYAVGIWPHDLSQALVLWSLVAQTAAAGPRRAGLLAALSGLLVGLSVGVRLQNVLFLALVPAAAALYGRMVPRLLVLWLSSAALPVLGMAAINQARLGTVNPFTYGGAAESARYTLAEPSLAATVLAGALLAGLLAVVVWRFRRRPALGISLGLAPLSALALLLWPPVQRLVANWLGLLGFHLFDSALLPAGTPLAGAVRNEWGQVLYGGVVKKGLFEAAPYLAAALLAMGALWRRDASSLRSLLAALALPGAALLPVILSSGGFCFNPRYLLELAPLWLLLAIDAVWPNLKHRLALLSGAAAGILLALPLFHRPGSVAEPADGSLVWIGLGLAAGLFVSLLLARIVPGSALAGKLAGAAFAAALGYSAMIQWGVDVERSRNVRDVAAKILDEARAVVPEKSLVLAWEGRKDVLTPLKLQQDVWIGGLGWRDRDAPSLVERALPARRVFVLENGVPEELRARLAGGRPTRREERRGLVFAEILQEGKP